MEEIKMNVKELSSILADMYNEAGDKEKVARIHLFGIKYGEEMIKNGISAGEIIKESGLNPSYATEVQKGIKIGRLMNEERRNNTEDLIDNNINYWFAGANYDGQDLTNEFIENGIFGIGWVNRSLEGIIKDNDKMLEMYQEEELESSGVTAFERLQEIKKGDMIALKKSYTEGENHGTSVLEINAIGVVLEDVLTGYKYSPKYRHTIPVKWTKIAKIKTVGGYWATLSRCKNKEKIEEVFGGIKEKNLIEVDDKREIEISISEIHKCLCYAGVIYSKDVLSNFYLSLKSKPFVILSGISGTGKSKLVRLFAEAIDAKFELIPVRPDWSDATELLGYKDINQVFHPGKLTQIIAEAKKDSDRPYIVCLDEMNLARVEYYFSDFLSLIESRHWEGDRIVTDSLSNETTTLGEPLFIPDNLYIIGTVNMDETTFQFSKKVLDRANTLELNEVDLTYSFEEDEEVEEVLVPVHNAALKSKYLILRDCKDYAELAERVIGQLINLNEMLKSCQMQFAYRVRDEIIFYMAYNQEYDLMSEEEAFDYQLLQKILPRINGTSLRLREMLMKLLSYCVGKEVNEQESYDLEAWQKEVAEGLYPRSATKVLEMLRRYDEDGFTSFWF